MTTMQPTASIDGFCSETATVNGVRLHDWIGGDPAGRPAVLWHGFLSTGHARRAVAPILAEAGLAMLTRLVAAEILPQPAARHLACSLEAAIAKVPRALNAMPEWGHLDGSRHRRP